jgi:hypothetical protein
VKRGLAVLACVLLGGCVYSLEPFYAKESLVASPVAAGKWQRLDKGGHAERGETWEFTADRVVVHDERGQWRELDAKYFRVGGMTFVDTYPRDLGSESPSEAYWALHRASSTSCPASTCPPTASSRDRWPPVLVSASSRARRLSHRVWPSAATTLRS